jgi:hypothetical protein
MFGISASLHVLHMYLFAPVQKREKTFIDTGIRCKK